MSINRTNIAEKIVEYQLELVNKTVAEAYKTPEWYHKWTMTTEQLEQVKKYAIPLIKKVLKVNNKKANDIFGWWDLQFGLRIDDNKTTNNEDLRDLEL